MQAPTAAPDAAPAAAAARTTGLDTPFKSVGASKKRAAPVMMPLRTGKIWATVTVVGQEMSQTPNVVCKDCGRTFCGGNTRIVALPHQVQGARAARPRQVGQARLLPRGAPPEGEGAARRPDAGYKALVEKWDTDSDSSDGSDDELDLAV